VSQIGNRMLASTNFMLIPGIVILALGAILSFYGYFA
jgi:hypothetical protein